MRKLTLTLHKQGKTAEELVINKDLVVTVRAFVDICTDYKVVEILTISSVISIIFSSYNRNEDITNIIDIDARNIINFILDESEGCQTYELHSNDTNEIDFHTKIRS